jgi:hypothetical protein
VRKVLEVLESCVQDIEKILRADNEFTKEVTKEIKVSSKICIQKQTILSSIY